MSNSRPDSLRLHMRSRAGMYIGGLNPRGLFHLLDGVVTDLLDLPEMRPERTVCTLGADGAYTVELRGGSIEGIEPEAFEADVGDDGVNTPLLSLKVVSGFSDPLHAEAVCGGRRWARTFAAGLPAGALDAGAASAPASLRIRYRPDPTLFPSGMRLPYLALCGRAREWAAFRPWVRITLEQEEGGQRRDYHYPAGLLSLAQELEPRWWWLDGASYVWHCRMTEGSAAAEAVFVRRQIGPAVVYSFVNGRPVFEEGTHLEGLRAGVAEVIPDGRGDDFADDPFLSADGRGPLVNLTVLLAVRLDNPRFGHSIRDALCDDRARDLVRRMIVATLPAEIERADRGEPPSLLG